MARRRRVAPPVVLDPLEAARTIGLRYVSDARPGIRRRRMGTGFAYTRPDGRAVRDPDTLARIRSLAVPPAWTDVWICPSEDGHIQAAGRDARGRKQYRYHARFRAFRDQTKFHKMIAFAKALPAIRARVAKDLGRPGLPREKVLATVVRLLETTLIRVGNKEYEKENRSYGLTTLKERHVHVKGSCLRFHFRGKSGKVRDVDVTDARLARIVRRCQELPGEELFQFEDDDGALQAIDSDDVNGYLRETAGDEFSAKDFRTWAGTVLVALALHAVESFDTKAQAKKNVVRAIESVAKQLGNTPAVCRKCYVHPAVIETYLSGASFGSLRSLGTSGSARSGRKLRPEEAAVLAFLEERLRGEAAVKKAA
jgi:DNA topoisomerase-1